MSELFQKDQSVIARHINNAFKEGELEEGSNMYFSPLDELLNKKKNYSPNIRNNKGETSFDRALNNNYLCTAMKFLKDKRFTSFDINSFKNLYNVVFKSNEYGKYTKLDTLEVVVDNLEKKNIDPSLMHILDKIADNMDIIKNDILNDGSSVLGNLINSYI